LWDFFNVYVFHWIPAKAIWIGGHTLSWDARCSGIYIGFGTGLAWHLTANRKIAALPPWPLLVINLLFFLPLFIDVLTIYSGIRMPSNDLRYLTGLFFGMALSVVVYPAFIIATHWASRGASSLSPRIFITLVALIFGAFFMKSWDSWIAYGILEVLAISGFVSLFSMLVSGAIKTLT
jgi:uncharacterized membrane protein